MQAAHKPAKNHWSLTAGTLTTLLVFGPIVLCRAGRRALRDASYSVVVSVGCFLIMALT